MVGDGIVLTETKGGLVEETWLIPPAAWIGEL